MSRHINAALFGGSFVAFVAFAASENGAAAVFGLAVFVTSVAAFVLGDE